MYEAILRYDGTQYYGWQSTVTGPSIQQALQTALHSITGESPLPEAASRTDRGVHARRQVVQFSLTRSIAPSILLRALNAKLPPDIRILSLRYRNFHPTLDAIGKEYHYRLSTGPIQLPMERLYAWHLHQPLDYRAMEEAAKLLLGTHDFSAFANAPKDDPICTLHALDILPNHMIVRGNRFLYKMVRNLVGTLVYVGLGKLSLNSLPDILQNKQRAAAGMTAPAHGLYLHEVFY